MKRKWMFAAVPVGIVLLIFIGGEVVMNLWNWLTPSLFGWKQISFWQAFGLLALCRILFGGVAGRGGGMARSNFRRRMAQRWDGMSPEEREQFCKGLHGHWGREAAASSSTGTGT
jgi:hypothetical protein